MFLFMQYLLYQADLILGSYSSIFYQEDNFCGILFAFLHAKPWKPQKRLYFKASSEKVYFKR